MTFVSMTPPAQGELIPPSFLAQLIDNDNFLRTHLGVLDAKLGFAEVVGSPGSLSVGAVDPIPGGYDALIIHAMLLFSANSANIQMRFNNDTGNNYGSARWLQTYSTGDNAASGSASSIVGYGSTGSFGDGLVAATMMIPRYDSTTFKKLASMYGARGVGIASQQQWLWAGAGYWSPATPEAITRIDLLPSTGDFNPGSYLAVFGAQHL